MRTFTALLLCFVYVAHATTLHALSELAVTGPIVVTSMYPDTTSPTLTGSQGPATYDGTTATVMSITMTFTYPGNTTVSSVLLALTSGSNVVKTFLATPVCASGTCTVNNGAGTYLTFNAAGAYSVSLTVYFSNQLSHDYSSSDLGGLSVNHWNSVTVSAVRNVPTPNSWAAVSPQNFGCESATSCTNAVNFNSTVTTPENVNYQFTAFMTSDTPASGVVYVIGGVCTGGSCTPINNAGAVGWSFGGYPRGANQFIFAGGPAFHTSLAVNGATYSTQSVAIQENHDNWFFSFTGHSIVANSGSADVTAPTCSAADLTPLTVTTTTGPGGASYTVTCTDGTGSGVALSGVILEHTFSNGLKSHSFAYQGTSGGPFQIYGYASFSTSIIGVFAVDFAGNAALYGTCAGVVSNQLSTICGSGSSSATSVAAQLFVVMTLLVAVVFHL